LSEIAGRYDAILVDQFGVLHDGLKPIPGAIHVLTRLKEMGKPIIIVSNTSKRKLFVSDLLKRLGFENVNDIACSGEMAWNCVLERFNGKKCCWFTWSDEKRANESWMRGLNISFSSAADADFLLFHGTETMVTSNTEKGTPISVFTSGNIDAKVNEAISIAVQRSIPVICANQDFTAMQPDGVAYMPGIFLNRYLEMGGNNLISFGKPDRSFFLHALDLAKAAVDVPVQNNIKEKKFRALHIGDSLHHDIAGAHAADIESLMITKHGVHRVEFYGSGSIDSEVGMGATTILRPDTGIVDNSLSSKQILLRKVIDLCGKEGIQTPDYILEELRW
jgi:HAD superfamily hydrolase (TIGR01459 family)